MDKATIDIANDQFVGVDGSGKYLTVMTPRLRMTKQQALRHAAWIVACSRALPGPNNFDKVLKTVLNT